MANEQIDKVAVREVHVAIPDVKFDEIVEILRKAWVVPKGPGISGL